MQFSPFFLLGSLIFTISVGMASAVPHFDSENLHKVFVQFCTSWGMKANFLRLREFILNEFPGQWDSIDGENYPPPDWAKTASSVISAVQLFVMLLFMMGDSLWTFVPGFSRGPPQFYYTVKENPVLAMIMLFLVIPSFVQSYINSGGEISILFPHGLPLRFTSF